MDEPSILEASRRFRIAAHRQIERSTVGPDFRASRGTVIALLDEARSAAVAWGRRYRQDAQAATGAHQPAAAAEFERRARDEEERAEMLTRRIEELGGSPAALSPDPGEVPAAERGATNVARRPLLERLDEDLRAEHTTIDGFCEIARYLWGESSIARREIEAIAALQRQHAQELNSLLAHLGSSAAARTSPVAMGQA